MTVHMVIFKMREKKSKFLSHSAIKYYVELLKPHGDFNIQISKASYHVHQNTQDKLTEILVGLDVTD